MRTWSLCLSSLSLVAGCLVAGGVGGGGTEAGRQASALPASVPAGVPTTLPAGAPEPAGALRVMTFNIQSGSAPDGDNAWPNRRALAFRVIREFRPVVLGLQEALRFQLDELRRELPRYGEVGVGSDDGIQAGEYAAILYDRNRLEVLRDGHFWLSDSPELPGSMTWGNRQPRIVTWAHFRDRTMNATFLAVNTQWDHESQEAREKGAHLMLHRLMPRGDAGDPLLIMGDLNCGRDNGAFRALEGWSTDDPENRPEWADTFGFMFPRPVAGSGTFHAFRGNRDGAKIDYVLVWPVRERNLWLPSGTRSKEWRVLQADIVHTNENGRYPSDHFPVTAIVMLTDVVTR